MGQPIVSMEGIEKRFSGVHALNQCRFELMAGEVHALVGENGAGKSTMMKILTGVYRKDDGIIRFKGTKAEITDTRSAQQLGISMIHQELQLMPDLTVAQNIFIGREPRRAWKLLLNEEEINRQTERLFGQMSLRLDPKTKVADLTVAKQQMVEIAKALSFQSEVLIMDEPTAALTETEIEDLFVIIEQLRKRGVGIVYISHRMDELKRITDRITVMRDGTYINTVHTKEVTTDQIISMMVGRELVDTPSPGNSPGDAATVLEVKHLKRQNVLHDISFRLKQGEILGVAGLMGAGRTELARAIFGADPVDSGEIFVNGQKVRIKQPYDAVQHGVGYLSEDRKQFGLMVEMDVKANIAVASYRNFKRMLGWMDDAAIRTVAEECVQSLHIKTPGVDQLLKNLSGGNQQKVVISKWLTRKCQVLMFDEPTRGIDVGAKAEIYRLLEELAKQGKSILMISSELPEILRMSNRILVMCEGRITGELNAAEATQEKIMSLATMRH